VISAMLTRKIFWYSMQLLAYCYKQPAMAD